MDFVLLSSITWDDQGGAHRPTQLSRALAAQGHRVFFLQILPYTMPFPDANIEITSLVQLGLTETMNRRAWFGFDLPLPDEIAKNLAARLDHFEKSDERVAVWTIGFPPFVRLLPFFQARGYKTAYDCLDDWSGADAMGLDFANPRAEEFIARYTDLTIVATPSLIEPFQKLQPDRRVNLVRNGLDHTLLTADRGTPAHLLRGELTLVFWGTLQDYTIDLQAVEFVARARPQWALNLIGQYNLPRSLHDDIQRLRELPNVRLHGYIPHAQLLDYGRHSDVLMIPYPDNPFSRGRDSIKLYGYVACERPIVVLRAPQFAFAPNVLLANSNEEFLAQIENARQYVVDREAARQFLVEHSWEKLAAQYAALLHAIPSPGRRDATSLPATFENLATRAERLERMTRELELIADERYVYARQLEAHAAENARYIHKLERTHPLIWLKRAKDRLLQPRR